MLSIGYGWGGLLWIDYLIVWVDGSVFGVLADLYSLWSFDLVFVLLVTVYCVDSRC